jgi:small subunit ribosomal protein S6
MSLIRGAKMNKYEAMFIIKPDLTEAERKTLFSQIHDVITKNNGSVASGSIWAEKRKLYFTIKKCLEGLYYLVNFSIPPMAIKEINHAYQLNENILRVLITKLE